MSQYTTDLEERAKTIDGLPTFDRVSDPIVVIKDRMIHVTMDDVDQHKVELKFQPYQALKLTTQDCYINEHQSVETRNKLIYLQTSAWLDELKKALQKKDKTATFMDKALHFIIPAGDDILEIAAWKIEIMHQGKTTIFPEGGK